MLKKFLASVGIGNAKVDAQLEKDRYTPGESLKGKVILKGGQVEQQVERINLFVMTEAVREKDDRKYYEDVVLERFTVGEAFNLGEGEQREVDFEFTLPIHTPPTINRTKVWLQTGLDVPNAVDPKDRDHIHVDPHPMMKTALDAIESHLGFRLKKVEMEYSRRYNYVQEFEFLPGHEFRSKLDELEAIFFLKPNEMEMVLQVDRRANSIGGLFAEALDMDENFVRVLINKQDVESGSTAVAQKLRAVIEQNS